MKKITFLLLTILPFLGFGQTYTFDGTSDDGWTSGASATVANNQANYYTSAGSLELVTTATNKVAKVNTTNTDAGVYTVSFKIKGNADNETEVERVKAILRDGVNNSLLAFNFTDLTSSTGGDADTWYEYTDNITLAPTQALQLQIQVARIGTYYIDDVSLTYTPPGGNTLTVNVNGGGTVAVSPDQVSYDPTDNVTLTATAATHWNFDSWSGDLSGSTNPETLLMDADKTVTANFVLDPTFDYNFTFDTDGELEGWEPDASVGVSGPTSGLVTLSLTADEWSRFNLYNFPIPATITDPSKYNKLTISLQNPSATTDQIGLVVNGTTTVFDLSTGDASIQPREFDLTAIPAWTGDITSFRIRFADADNPSGTSQPSESHDIIIDDITFSFDAALNTSEFLADKLSMFPNPTKGQLNLNYQGTINKVQIFDITGKTVIETGAFTNSTQVNISNLNRGIYLVKLTDESSNSAIKKLIVN